MKVDAQEDETLALPEREYPWVGIARGTGSIVLFSARSKGVLLAGSGNIGQHSAGWCDSYFEPFNGTLTFSGNLPR